MYNMYAMAESFKHFRDIHVTLVQTSGGKLKKIMRTFVKVLGLQMRMTAR